jgi:hypothetical protein
MMVANSSSIAASVRPHGHVDTSLHAILNDRGCLRARTTYGDRVRGCEGAIHHGLQPGQGPLRTGVLQHALGLEINFEVVLVRRELDRISTRSSSWRVSRWSCIRFWSAQSQRGREQTLQNPVPGRGMGSRLSRRGARPGTPRAVRPLNGACRYGGRGDSATPCARRTRSTMSPSREYCEPAHATASLSAVARRCRSPRLNHKLRACCKTLRGSRRLGRQPAGNPVPSPVASTGAPTMAMFLEWQR